MRIKPALALLAAFASVPAAADTGSPQSAPASTDAAPAAATPPPRLIIAVSVDQFSADLFAQYRQTYRGGIAKLLQGAVFPSGFQSHAATETCPGHSTILTGVHPSRTGIVANNWFDLNSPRAEKRIYCVEDESNPASTSRQPVVSAVHLRVPTLGDRMKATWPGSRNIAVSGKDRAVVMMGGHNIDQGYWWGGKGFVTFAGRTPGSEALAVNADIARTLRKGAKAYALPPGCAAHDRATIAGKVTVGTGRFALAPDKGNDFRVSPRLDNVTLDLAARLVTGLKLGKGPTPDILSISLSATDYIGHGFGTEGVEMCIQMANLDAALGLFFAKVDRAGLDYAVVLTADHGGLDLPERLASQALPGAMRVDPALAPQALGKAISAKLGLGTIVPKIGQGGPASREEAPSLIYAEGPGGDYYVTRDLPPDLRNKVIAELAATLKASPQVEAVFTRDEVARARVPFGRPQDWTLLERVRASYDPERSADVITLLRRAIVPIIEPSPGYVATHGSPWDYDRRVPMLFWRKGLTGFEQPSPVETVDIAPTLASLLHLPVPDGSFDGRCLDIDGGRGNTCE